MAALRGAPRAVLQPLLDVALSRDGTAAVLAAARDYVVLPTLAHAALRVGVDDGAGSLRAVVETVAVDNGRLQQTLAVAVTALQAAGLSHLALKGAALFAAGHVPLAARHADDVDLLVDDGAAAAALAALARAGFVQRTPLIDGTIALRRGDDDVELDLHLRLPGTGETLTELLPDSEVVDVDGVAVTVPRPGALLAQLCDHVVIRHKMWPRYWPRHVADVRALSPWARGDVVLRGPVALSLAVTAGIVDDDAPAPLQALAHAFVLPGLVAAAGHGARFVASRAVATVAAGHWRAFFPDEDWLQRSGDLRPGHGVWQARASRLVRVAGRARGRPRDGGGR